MGKKDIPALVKDDRWLEPYTDEISDRIRRYEQLRNTIESEYKSLEDFSSAYQYFGINYDHDNKGWWYREWAPAAEALYFTGDFNQWDRFSHRGGKRTSRSER